MMGGGGGSGPDLICYKVVGTSTGGSLSQVWATAPGAPARNAEGGSPTVGQVSVPSPYALVWVVGNVGNAGTLYAFDALAGGPPVFDSSIRPTDDLGQVPHYPAITCAGTSTFVGTGHGFAC